MLMSAIDRAVDAVPLIVVVLTERFEQTLPDTPACPAVEAIEHRLPRAKIARQISPRSARTPPPQYRFHEVAIVPPRPPGALPHAQRAALIFCHCRSSNCRRIIVNDPWSRIFASMESRLLSTPVQEGPRQRSGQRSCAPSWARRARAWPAPETSAYQTNGPNDSSRTVGHGHGHGHGHARAILI